jgi:hypothetical protein
MSPPLNLQAFAVSGSGTCTITLNPTADLPQGRQLHGPRLLQPDYPTPNAGDRTTT